MEEVKEEEEFIQFSLGKTVSGLAKIDDRVDSLLFIHILDLHEWIPFRNIGRKDSFI
jgi:hypothetical protein